ncbi:uncharacterized protein LOC119608056 [Lucilia sericata]|uniref:uncharacterized protein LOC119608056 n=1 Tax=Lucilia sericata TaxID=13632 RepID=UPI0018A85D3C|nr:uncharacterized protein LOC119608056 [Lucilia sericata]
MYHYCKIIIIILISISKYNFIQACPIYLTIGLDGSTYQESTLHLNWASDCFIRPEWYGIYNEEPSTTLLQPFIRLYNISNATFQMSIKQKIGKLKFPKGWNRNDADVQPLHYTKSKCLDYYVASFQSNELLSVECLKIYPTWMTKQNDIVKMQLKELFIPGTHASGAYLTNYGATKSLFIREHAVSQYFDVWSQLVFGIRYLDLSIGYKPVDLYDPQNPENFWIVNENMFINQLRFVLKDVRKFVTISGEVVILDFSSFPIGFYKHPERHTGLLHLITNELGHLAFQRTDRSVHCYDLTIEEIIATNGTIIILYPLEELPHPENESPILCSPWKRFSTGFMNNSQALDYMRLLFSKKKTSPVRDEGWIFNAIKCMEQSLNTNKLQTAKERALHINTKVSNWLRGPWGSTANIVTLDYFSSTNIIDVAIYANIQKAFLKLNKDYVKFEITEK